jgi:hypothetical protein
LFVDTVDELHEFASRIGLKRQWAQLRRVPHYDLTAAMSAKALRLGAVLVDRETEAAFSRRHTKSQRRI